MNLQVRDFQTDCYRSAILTDQILGGSVEIEIVGQRLKEVMNHCLFPMSSISSIAGSFISREVVEDRSEGGESLSMADLAVKMFPEYKELSKEESKKHSDVFLSFFD